MTCKINRSTMLRYFTVLLFFLFSVSLLYTQEEYKEIINNDSSFTNEKPHRVVKTLNKKTKKNKPKNIILLIGDGMGLSQVYAAMTVNGGQLNIAQMPYTGFSITTCYDKYITDSGAGGTAIAIGKKTYYGALGVDAEAMPSESILEIAEKHSLKTGLVSTSAITHATPASFIAHQKSRNMYEEIANDFLNTDIDVFIGGGKKHFIQRKDGRNLLTELKTKGYQVGEKLTDIEDLKRPYAVLTDSVHTPKYPHRGELLPDATDMAVKTLSTGKKGFFLMVEGSQIDWGCHQNNTDYLLLETLDFDKAVGKALEFAVKDKNTLVIVTADHETGGMAIVGGNFEKHTIQAKYASTKHTAVMVPVFAYGPGADCFTGIYQNTDIFKKMKLLFGFK